MTKEKLEERIRALRLERMELVSQINDARSYAETLDKLIAFNIDRFFEIKIGEQQVGRIVALCKKPTFLKFLG